MRRIELVDSANIENLDELSLLSSSKDEERALEIADVARECARSTAEYIRMGLDIAEIIPLLVDSLDFGTYPSHSAAGDSLYSILSLSTTLRRSADKLVFVSLYLASLSEMGITLSEDSFLRSGSQDNSVAYVKNQLSDEAYDVFSQDFRRLKVSYKSNFKECADALAAGEVGYIILPLEERGGNRISSVASLILSGDFKINAVTSVFGYLGDADVKYALISRNFLLPVIYDGDDKYVELRVGDNPEIYKDIFIASSYFGLSANRITTVKPSLTDERGYLSLVLRAADGDLTGILTYLTLFIPDAVAVGVYKNLE